MMRMLHVQGNRRKRPRVVLHIALVLTASLALAACSSGEKVIKVGAAVNETGGYTEDGKHTPGGLPPLGGLGPTTNTEASTWAGTATRWS